MKNLTSRKKILLGCLAMVLAMIGDYLLGFGTFSTSSSPDAYMGITANVVPDWRYAISSLLGFLCVPLFAVAALELMKVMEKKYALGELMNFIVEGMDSGFESFGWLLMYLICAMKLVGKEERL